MTGHARPLRHSLEPLPSCKDARSQKLSGRVTRGEKKAVMKACLEETHLRGEEVKLGVLMREIILADPRVRKHLQ